MATIVISPDQDAIHAEVLIAAPAERVFQALADPRQLLEWRLNLCPFKAHQNDPRRLIGKSGGSTAGLY
jgi:uncharacterized protein YndB with AHSA1/START domain